MDLYYLVYTSSPARIMDDSALHELLAISRQANARFGITGMLLYFPDSFIQLIEGPQTHIQQLYQNIQRDRRHFRVTTLREGPIASRFFPDWAMAFDRRDSKEQTDALALHDEKVMQLFAVLES